MRKFFARLNPHVQTAAGWLAVLGTIMSGAYAALSKGAALFGELNWAEAILIGIGLTLATGLAVTALLLMGAYAFRLIRPLPVGSMDLAGVPVLDHNPDSDDEAALDSRIEGAIGIRLGELQRDTVAETFKASDGRFASMFKHFEEVTKRLGVGGAATEKLAKEALAEAEGAMSQFRQLQSFVLSEDKEIREAADAALVEQREFQAKMETWVGNLQRRLRYGLASVDHALAAILDREKMEELATEIEVIRDELSGPTEKREPMGDGNAWLAKYGGWYRNLEAWARLGEKYRRGTLKRVFAVIDSDYEGKWKATDDLFQSSIEVQKYKTFRIYSRNFFAEREVVERCVEQAAFVHPTQRAQPVLEEEDDDDQPYIPPPSPQV